MPRKADPKTRRIRAIESFKTAAECIGEIEKGMALFAITRGQFSMIDAIKVAVEAAAPCIISIWTWTVADYEVQCLKTLQHDSRITGGRLVIDAGARVKNAEIIADWKRTFGPESVRYVKNHAKIATVEGNGLRLLLRGSMNLNFNPRFEQFDMTEGGMDFDLVRKVELELPILKDSVSNSEVFVASKLSEAYNAEQLQMFDGIKVWTK